MLLLLPLVNACAAIPPTVYQQHVLADEILSPRPDHPGKLTNQACVTYLPDGTCHEFSIKEYDLADPAFQAQVNSLGIVCRMVGHRYKVCLNEKDAAGAPMVGFCSISYTHSCGLFGCGSWKRHVAYLPVVPWQTVLDSGITCRNETEYPIDR